MSTRCQYQQNPCLVLAPRRIGFPTIALLGAIRSRQWPFPQPILTLSLFTFLLSSFAHFDTNTITTMASSVTFRTTFTIEPRNMTDHGS